MKPAAFLPNEKAFGIREAGDTGSYWFSTLENIETLLRYLARQQADNRFTVMARTLEPEEIANGDKLK